MKFNPIFLLTLPCMLCMAYPIKSQTISLTDTSHIKPLVVNLLDEYEHLLNAISSTGITDFERDKMITNSFLHRYGTQIFENNEVIVEDDLQPEGEEGSVKDLTIQKYLKDIKLFYSKNDSPSVKVDYKQILSVSENSLLVYFESKFSGKHILYPQFEYPTRKRVALILVTEDKENKWALKIRGITFFNELYFQMEQKDANTINIKQITLHWEKLGANEHTQYEVYDNQTLLGAVEDTTISLSLNKPLQEYDFQVKVKEIEKTDPIPIKPSNERKNKNGNDLQRHKVRAFIVFEVLFVGVLILIGLNGS